MRLSEASELYLARRKQEGYSPFTLSAYRIQHSVFIRDAGDLDVTDATEEILRRHIGRFVEKMKPSSLAHKVRALKVFFAWLQEEEIILKNPARKIKEPKIGKRIPKAMTMDEVEAIRDGCRNDFERALVEIFFATGCRVGEVERMNRGDVDFDRRAIRVIGKGNKEREVYYGSKAAIRLRKYLEGRTDKEQALFITQRRPYRRMPTHALWWNVKGIAQRSGVARNVSPHIWRHTLATMLLNQGAPLESVQSILGHEKPETTQIYAVLSGERRHEDYKKYFVQ